MGLSPSGAADPIALRLGNRLVGNADGAAALEMTLIGGTFLFPEGGMVALAGSDFGASLDDQPVTMWVAVKIKSGQTLRLGPTRSGARCYLCIQGGIKVNSFLGSASTHILSGLGGLEGRALRKGDVLNVGHSRLQLFAKEKFLLSYYNVCRRAKFYGSLPALRVIGFPSHHKNCFTQIHIA